MFYRKPEVKLISKTAVIQPLGPPRQRKCDSFFPRNLIMFEFIYSACTMFTQVDVIIAEESWSVGNLEAQNLYEDEREVLPEEEDDETNTDENEFEEVRWAIIFTLTII